MNLTGSVFFFGVPGAIIYAGLYFGVPVAIANGVPLIVSWSVALWLPIVLLLGWVVVRTKTAQPQILLGDRFRLTHTPATPWVIVIAVFIVLQVCEVALSGTGAYFAGFAVFAPPAIIPELFNPTLDVTAGLNTFFGVPVQGNWWLVLFWLGWLVINIGGEELLWRGYVLPLQERAIGKYAWLVNGLCWNLLIHAFMPWNYLTLMPVSLAIPYLVQRFQNTWIGIYIHGLGNLMVLAILVPSIAGWM